MPESVIVVPCYNEEHRLPAAVFERITAPEGLSFLFVDDGSADGTPALLAKLAAARPGLVDVLRLPRNCGKAEAVRAGMLAAAGSGAGWTGFLDADLATPLPELFRLLELAESGRWQVALASRVRLLGLDVKRSATRHYLGRVFATLASAGLGLPVYDTQCGAKAFRVTPAFLAALRDPFLSRWAFDVELIGRLLAGTPDVPGLEVHDFVEMPLTTWRDVRGSKITPLTFPRMGIDLGRILLDLRSRRRETGRAARPVPADAPPAKRPRSAKKVES